MLKKSAILLATTFVAAAGATALAQSARDYISIVGSSTVYPFATVVAEHFGKATKFKTPKIESTGSGGGLKLFCQGVGVQHPDITNSSRRMKKSELETCRKNGVTDVIEVKIGYDGITIANAQSAPKVNLTQKELWLALAKEVPDASGQKLIANPYKSWDEINLKLPKQRIQVLGPPPTSGTRDAFVELVMDEGCAQFPLVKALDKKDHKRVCQTMREDGAFVEAGENDNLIVQKLVADPNAFGIFGFSFLDQNRDKIKGAAVSGVEPSFKTIADSSYPVSRPLYFYVKKAHIAVIPGMKDYLAEFTSEKAWGEEGYLSERGLIPMPKTERQQFARAAKQLSPLASL